MIKQIIFKIIFFGVFLSIAIPLLLNIKVNELSNSISEINKDILSLEREKAAITLKHSELYSVSNIDKLSKRHFYVRLDISQKINLAEIQIKLNDNPIARDSISQINLALSNVFGYLDDDDPSGDIDLQASLPNAKMQHSFISLNTVSSSLVRRR